MSMSFVPLSLLHCIFLSYFVLIIFSDFSILFPIVLIPDSFVEQTE